MTSAPEPAEMDIVTPGRSGWRNLSFVWLVPILALIVSLGVAWKTYSERGGLIEITFTTAAGVTPGETTIRFREVVIGTVETVGFTDDRYATDIHWVGGCNRLCCSLRAAVPATQSPDRVQCDALPTARA